MPSEPASGTASVRSLEPRGGSWRLLARETERRRREGVQLELELRLGPRAERCIGLAIRKGQEEGRIAKRGDISGAKPRDDGRAIITVREAARGITRDEIVRGCYATTDNISADQFEKAIAERLELGPGASR